MIKEFAGLLLALTKLNPGRFLLLSLGLAASFLAGFLAVARPQFLGVNLRLASSLLWVLAWCITSTLSRISTAPVPPVADTTI